MSLAHLNKTGVGFARDRIFIRIKTREIRVQKGPTGWSPWVWEFQYRRGGTLKDYKVTVIPERRKV